MRKSNVTTQTKEDVQFEREANADFDIQMETMKTKVATVTTRKIVDATQDYDDVFMQVNGIPKEYEVDTKPLIQRPFYVGSVSFPNTAARYSLLTNPIKYLPGDIARSNPTILNSFKMAALGRPDAILNISLAGTISHAGCVLVGVLPPLPAYPTGDVRYYINTAMSGPHAFLNANEATSVVLPVPWYCNSDLATLDMEIASGYVPTLDLQSTNGNYGTLVFIVMNPLAPSNGASTTLTIVIEACFKNFEMVVPSPRYVSWAAQAGKLSMINPVYDAYDKLLLEMDNVKEVDTPEAKKEESTMQKLVRRARYVSLALAAINLATCIRTYMADVDINLDDVLQLVPQMGLLGSIVPGLADGAANIGKKLTGDLIDELRAGFKSLTGLHNPNEAVIRERDIIGKINFSNMVDGQQYFEKLDPLANTNRIVKEPLFGTTLDEMDISHITSKDQFLGSFVVDQNFAVGKLVWNRPISPYQGGMGIAPDGIVSSNNIELMHSLHRAWRGGLKLKIQSVMNNKQQVKIKVIKYYNPSVQALTQQPLYTSIVNAPSHLLEFTQGGQTLEVDLPYLCRNALCPRAENTDVEGMLHGMYYIYVAQPLVTADGSPTRVEFNVYMSGAEDLQFYGYTTANIGYQNFSGPPPAGFIETLPAFVQSKMVVLPKNKLVMVSDDKATVTEQIAALKVPRGSVLNTSVPFVLEHSRLVRNSISTDPEYWKDAKNYFAKNGRLIAYKAPRTKQVWKAQSGKLEVMNEPQDQETQMTKQRNRVMLETNRLAPNFSVRDIIRRLYKTENVVSTIEPSSSVLQPINLGSYLYEVPDEFRDSPIGWVSRMYYGKTAGFKFRIAFTQIDRVRETTVSLNDLDVRVYYQPQSMNQSSASAELIGCGVNTNAYVPFPNTSTSGEPPMTYQIYPVSREGSTAIYEFTVPDTSVFKFMGSPNKFLSFGSALVYPYLAIGDFGSLAISISNTHREEGITFAVEQFVGLTDESRMGHHSIAPPFRVRKQEAFYLGTNSSGGGVIPNTLNPVIYKGGLL